MFKGLYTAVITPFTLSGAFDAKAFEKILEQQVSGGVDGIVVLGTTGESPTIDKSESLEIFQKALDIVKGRVTMIAGTGSNCTKKAVEMSLAVEALGYDGLLQVNPYYNKPTQEGLYQHFKAVADSVNIPIILYNIMGRCGVNLETPTLLRLAAHKNIVAVKEASGDLTQIEAVINQVPKGFTVLSGDDNLTLDLMKMGGHGVVSVLSNALPSEMAKLVKTCAEKKWDEATVLSKNLEPLFGLCFIEPNPQPIKTLMADMDLCETSFRLPMISMQEANKKTLLAAWSNFKK